MLRRGHGVVVALALTMLGVALPSAGSAAQVVAQRVTAQIDSNGGGNRLDVVVRVSTGRPRRSCDGVARMAGRRSWLRTLVTGAKGGGQWHWYLGDGARRASLSVTVTCRFPDGKTGKRLVRAKIGPGPYPRRSFRHVVEPGSLRLEAWVPVARYDGSGGSANLYPKGQCTWYVARQRPDLPYFAGRAGDAKNWLTSAEQHKLPTGTAPRVGAVAVFQPGQYDAGLYGHVAYVTKVDGARMTVREANFGGHPSGSPRTIAWAGVRFIYRETLPPASGPAPSTPAPAAAPTAPPVSAPVKPPPIWPTIDLKTSADARLGGAGDAVSAAGDVNGDGYDDVLVSDSYAHNNGQKGSGSVWVVFGRPGLGGRIDLFSLGAGGFRIDGAAGEQQVSDSGDAAGSSVSAIGDVDGDGKDDILVGAPFADNNGRMVSGSAYVVFGKSDGGTISLASLGGHGYRIDGAATYDLAGGGLAGIGDVNGDGRPDVAIGASGADNLGRDGSGSVYVVFGKATTATVDLAALGSGGYRIDGADAGSGLGSSISRVGDMNGDGRPDIVVGAPSAMSTEGRAYVVMGKADTAPIDLAVGDLSDSSFAIRGEARPERLGTVVAGVGDVNGDGRPDVAVTAPDADNNARGYSGSTYVIFGKRDSYAVDLQRLGTGGFRIDGAGAMYGDGSSAAAAGDVNEDGLADLLLGASGADFAGRTRAGAATVVFGKRDAGTIDLASLSGSGGFVMGGAADYDFTGSSSRLAGDVNDDGRDDFIIDAPFSELVTAPDETFISGGAAYLVYGRPPPS